MPETRTDAGNLMLNRRIARRSGVESLSGPCRRSIRFRSAGTDASLLALPNPDSIAMRNP